MSAEPIPDTGREDGTLAELLSARIAAGEFRPGRRLSEAELAERFSVSRNTLREAFRVLAEQGLLEHVPHRGVSVTAPRVADVLDIYRVRRHLETGVLVKAAPQHPATARMRGAVEAAEAAAAAGDWAGVGTANMAFHAALVSLSDSPRLGRTYRQLSAELRLAFLVIGDPQALHGAFVERNRSVLETFVADGGPAAARELEDYLTESERTVLGAYARLGLG
ncbi:DNA-binding GntR family transcriptional regulator [Kineococcus radiotolerans]|uniref:DNA-binding GntR family transcriptional regulator n=1 Tax=Kineococcus radiotolerans TaxID=131568 RepID=A0A7W4TLK1_KINRA|nr:GntR family transcriptional regulator [Kineococcus radiotolerans]MBB2900823.1 DNA-binding GntR family transcriptional regulator [Kineococcus radiotolerans]